MATLQDVAETAGVSKTTVSRYLNKSIELPAATVARIDAAIARHDYRPNVLARRLSTGRTNAIGLVVPDMTNPFFPSLAQTVVQRARQSGYSVFVTDTEGDQKQEAEVVRQLIDRGVDGIVWFPVNDENSISRIATDLPIIVLDRTIPGFECIQADYAEGGRLASDYLIGLGHRNIGIIAGPLDVRSMCDRCEAAREVIETRGTLAFSVENAFSTELSHAVANAISKREATAVFCGSDLIAIGVMRYAVQQGIRIPEDLSVVGFDDIPWAEYCTPGLSTVEMPVDEMAVEAVDALLRKIDGESDANRRVLFGVNLIERASARAM